MNVIWSLQKQRTRELKDKQKSHLHSYFFSFYFTIIAASLPFWGEILLTDDFMSVSLESALTLSLLASCGTQYTQLMKAFTCVPSLHSCNLHPPLCLECFTINQLPHSPTSRSHAEKRLSSSLTSSTHELWLSYNVIKTNIPVYIIRYKAYSIHYTVKSEFCARKTTQSFHEHCSLRKKYVEIL